MPRNSILTITACFLPWRWHQHNRTRQAYENMATLRRPVAIMASSLFAASLTLSQGFFVGPALGVGAGALCSSNTRRLSSRCRCEREATQQGGLTMRGIHKKGKNGPGLTGIQRVLNTRERVQEVEDPCKVMISNLDYSLTEEDVKVFCSAAGPVTAVKLIKKRYAKTSKGFGFVDFEQPLTATIALEELNGKEFHGRIVELKPAITTREKRIQEATGDWEQRSLEKERRSAEGYADEDEGEKKPESKAKAVVPSKDGTIKTTDEFFDFVGRRVKPKPQVPVEEPE